MLSAPSPSMLGSRWPVHVTGTMRSPSSCLRVERDPERRVRHAERLDDLVAEVPVDRPAVDGLDDRPEDLPARDRVVRRRRPRDPVGGVGGDAPDRRFVRDVFVERLVAEHREAAGVGEHVAERAALLAVAPAVDVVGDEVVEPELPALPELEDRDRGERLARRVPEHESSVRSARPGIDSPMATSSTRLAAHRDVALGALVTAFNPLLLEDLDDHGRVDRFPSGLRSIKSVGHCAEAYGGGRALNARRSAQMSSVVEVEPKGWRPDPSGRYEWRYWDGGWTNRVANSAPSPSSVLPPADMPAPAARARRRRSRRTPHGRPRTTTPGCPRASPSSRCSARWKPDGPPPRARPSTRTESSREPSAPRVRQPRTAPWPAVVRWFRSFTDEPESYHSPKAGVALEPHSDQITILAATPANYGRAGLVALAACGVGIGAYLPWLSGTIDGLPFERTGLQLGHSWGFTWLAGALALAAMLGVRVRAAALGQHGAGHRWSRRSSPASSSTSTSRSTT